MFDNYHLLLLNIKEGILMLDKNGYITYCNPAITAMSGFTDEELIGQPIHALNDGNDDGIQSDYELDVAHKSGKFVSQGWRVRKGGDRYWGELNVSPAYGKAGIHLGYCCVLRDTTERKNNEIKILQSEERYRLMVEGVTGYSIFMLDPNGYILTWNDGARHMTGYLADEIIGKHFSVFYRGEDLLGDKPETELRVAVQDGMYMEEGWRAKKNGSVFWASVVLTPLFNQENKLIGYSKVTRDLTERLQNEKLLRQSEARYRSLVEQVIDYGIFMMDEKGRIVSWNEGARRIKGYSSEEIIGKYFTIFYPQEDIIGGKPSNELKIARAEGRYEEEGWRLRKDGSRFWANIIITAVYNSNKILVGYSKVTRDLTEKKRGERLLKESNLGLQMLANELQKTNAELSYANQELEQFTSIVSHDLKEPIRTLQSFLLLMDLRLDADSQQELKAYVGKSRAAADRMKMLIENLLHYSQISKIHITRESVEIGELIDLALQNLRGAIDESGATISVSTEVQSIQGDRSQLVQLIQNLAGNAIKFVDGTTAKIQISVTRHNQEVQFAVSDNGIGISLEDRNKIFEVFRRLHTVKDYPGTGMGLAICKKIIERHKGKIWCESQVGIGTTFYFTIPHIEL
jgi:PAS domain S-box-containing protein